MRVRAGERGQVSPGHLAIGLWTEPSEHAGVGESLHGVDPTLGGAARAEDRLQRHPADVGRGQGPLHDGPDLVVVHAQRCRHDQGCEDPSPRQSFDRRLLEAGQIRTAVVDRRSRRRPVVLEINLDPLTVPGQQRQQLVIPSQRQSVGVDHDPHDGAGHDLLDDPLEVGMEGGLAAREHEDVEATVLAGQLGIDVRQHSLDRRHPRPCRRGLGKTGRALEVAVVEEVFEQDAGVLGLHLGQAIEIGRGHRRPIAAPVWLVHLGRRCPLLQIAQDLG